MGDVSHSFFRLSQKGIGGQPFRESGRSFLGPIALLNQGAWLASITPCLATIQECGAFTTGS
jgi:hypothetical protein